MQQEQRIDSLTGIRGLAALLVVYAHLTEEKFFTDTHLFPGEMGVMVFFTLSGFLMAFLYGEKDASYPSVARYAISRFSRIAPAYLTVVLASYLIYNLIDPHFVYAISNDNLLRHLLFSGNVSALWSIPPEVQFYVIFVGIWFALHASRTKSNITLMVAVLGSILMLIAYRAHLPGTFVGSKIHYFLAGLVLGLVRTRVGAGVNMTTLALLQAGVIALVLAVIAGVVDVDLGSKRELYLTLETAGFAGIFVFLFSFDTALSKRLLGNRLTMLIGECSFSVYLLNIPIIYAALVVMDGMQPRPALALPIGAITIAAAWSMYRLVEMPGNTLLRRLGTRLLLPPRTAPVPSSAITSVPTDVQPGRTP
ncbi:acyltransferase [Xanthomonas oryzae pv. oryzae]|uniref:acyltransferase family protein n=1 Tax=Xanthomonas oryzae TaxID=347 RepID=UPI000C79E308|nr:acyltransferase [Xanthomonas oryzae]AUJ12296.1 acyltransferase [Xanthomonas oryzae pv. oryzae]